MANLNFDASNVPPAETFDVLPPGKYEVQIVRSEMRATKAGDGQYLWLEMNILSGPYTGRKLWDQLNLVNNNQQAVEIAQRTLSAICRAVGRVRVSDSEELHFTPLLVTVKVQPAGPDKHGIYRDAQNRIGGYSPVGGAPQQRAVSSGPPPHRQGGAPHQPHQQAPAQPTAPQGNTPPWRRTG